MDLFNAISELTKFFIISVFFLGGCAVILFVGKFIIIKFINEKPEGE